MNKYPLDGQAIEDATRDIVANDRAQRQQISKLCSLLKEALNNIDDDDLCEEIAEVLSSNAKRNSDYEIHRFNQTNGHNTKKNSPYSDASTNHLGAIDTAKEVQLNEIESSFGGEMDEEELAQHFNERPKKKKKTKKVKEKTLEEIEEWERAQDNSNDIYKVSARIKNAARFGAKANLTAQGDMMCNTFTHLIKAFYDFADTIQDKELRMRLVELTKKQEEVPATLIVALGAGVRAPE